MAHGEEGDGEEDGDGADAEAPIPTLVGADPHHQRHPHRRPRGEAEEKPVEEARESGKLSWVVLVELVRPQRRQRRLHSARPQRHHVEPCVEYGSLATLGLLALAGDLAMAWLGSPGWEAGLERQ